MEVYKVVYRTGNVLESATAMSKDFFLTYEIGKPTYPPAICAYALPLAFSTLDHAINFVEKQLLGDTEIYRAEASGGYQTTELCSHTGRFLEFWVSGGSSAPAPNGTLACNDITLIKKVWPEDDDESI